MKLMIFVVHDSAAEAYLQPFFARSKGEALRSFETAVNDEGHQFAKHADDYTLFQIGTYEDSTGMIEPSAPVSLGCAVEYRKPARRVDGESRQIDLEDVINGR